MAKEKSRSGLYPVSWQNRFYRVAYDLPVPPLVFYVGFFAFFVFINHLASWLDGDLPWWNFDPLQFNFHIWYLVVFIAGDYFLLLAESTLEKFRPSLAVSDREYASLTHRFVNLTRWQGLFMTSLAVLSLPLVVQFGAAYQLQGMSLYVLAASGLFMFAMVFAFIFWLARSLLLTAHMYSLVTSVNIFHLDSLNSFSVFTSRVGIFLVLNIILSYLTNLVVTDRPLVGGFVFFGPLNLIVAIIGFVFPLSKFHQRLQTEKEKAKAENNRRLDLAQKKLHRLVDRNGKGVIETKTAISGLLELRHELERISTWPWNTSTLTTFISALFLPLVIWLIQQLLSRLL